jgi:hypothetical protein
VEQILRYPLKGRLLSLPANIRLGRKALQGANTLVYFNNIARVREQTRHLLVIFIYFSLTYR